MNGGEETGDEEEGEWLPVLQTEYAFARSRHALAREDAYAITRVNAIEQGLCGPELRIADIDEDTFSVWQRTWKGVHPSGAGGWNWRMIVENIPRRAAVLPFRDLVRRRPVWPGGGTSIEAQSLQCSAHRHTYAPGAQA